MADTRRVSTSDARWVFEFEPEVEPTFCPQSFSMSLDNTQALGRKSTGNPGLTRSESRTVASIRFPQSLPKDLRKLVDGLALLAPVVLARDNRNDINRPNNWGQPPKAPQSATKYRLTRLYLTHNH